MTVRKLRAKQRGPNCSYCVDCVQAVYRGCHFTRFACSSHKDELVTEDARQSARDNHQSDAEWMLGL